MEEEKKYHPFEVGDVIKLKSNRGTSRGIQYQSDMEAKVTRLDGFTGGQIKLLKGRGYLKHRQAWAGPGAHVLAYLDAFEKVEQFKIWW